MSTSSVKRKPRSEHFSKGVDYSWHHGNKLLAAVKQFNERHALQPKQELAKANELNKLYTKEIQKRLKDKGICGDLEYTGSVYERVKVAKTEEDKDLEFDIMIVISGTEELEVEQTNKPGFVQLRQTGQEQGKKSCSWIISKAADKNGYILPHKLASCFTGELESCLQKCQDYYLSEGGENQGRQDGKTTKELKQLQQIKNRIKLRRHGPAVQMDIKKHPVDDDGEIQPENPDESVSLVENHENSREEENLAPERENGDNCEEGIEKKSEQMKRLQQKPKHEPSDRDFFYSVDMVPTIKIRGQGGDEYYVAKPLEPVSKNSGGLVWTWRRSFSIQEKDKLSKMDQGGGCRKQVLRMLKVIRNREAGLAKLTSYHLKTVLFRVCDDPKLENPEEWKPECLGKRLMDVIRQLEKELYEEQMKHFFLPTVNILDGINPKTIYHMRQRLMHLKNSEKRMLKLLTRKSTASLP